jgi:hypothetical protein
MKTSPLALLFLALLLSPGWAGAITYSYPNTRAPLFSLDLPEDWQVKTEQQVLHASPPDGSVYLGFWALDAGVSGDDVGDAVEEIVSSMVQDYSIDEEDELEINGIPLYYFQGGGNQEDGSPIRYGVGMFSPNGENVCVVFFFGAPEDERRHTKTLRRIINSIQRG